MSNPTFSYVSTELNRARRNSRYLMFAVAIPVFMFLAFSSGHDTISNYSVGSYIMVSMASFGAMSCVLFTAGRIGVDRASGWNRQLRLTALSGRSYVLGKVVAAMVTALAPIIIVMAVAHFSRNVDLAAGRWVAVIASVILSLLPLAAFAIWLGYRVRPEGMQTIAPLVFNGLALIGGLWIPVEQFPSWLADISKALPMYWVANAGREALVGSWVGWTGLSILVAWTVALGVLAGRSYVRDSLRA